MRASVLAEALVRWQHAAGPFWPYVCAAPFLGTGDAEALARRAWSEGRPGGRYRLSRQAVALADRLLGDPPPPCPRPLAVAPPVVTTSLVVILVDLPAEPILALAPLLVERGWYVVPVVQRWIATPAVLPCRLLLERLLHGAWQVRRPQAARGAVLIADGARTGPGGYPATVPGRTFDNRYEYQICRFPSTVFLHAQGVRRVRWITSSTRAAERPVRPDLAPYLEELLRSGITVDVLPWSA